MGHVLPVMPLSHLPEPAPLEAVAAERDATTVALTLVAVTPPGKAQRARAELARRRAD